MKKRKIECQACFDEEGSYACIRPAHRTAKIAEAAIDQALKELRRAVDLKDSYVPDRLGGYTNYHAALNTKKARKILEKMVSALR